MHTKTLKPFCEPLCDRMLRLMKIGPNIDSKEEIKQKIRVDDLDKTFKGLLDADSLDCGVLEVSDFDFPLDTPCLPIVLTKENIGKTPYEMLADIRKEKLRIYDVRYTGIRCGASAIYPRFFCGTKEHAAGKLTQKGPGVFSCQVDCSCSFKLHKMKILVKNPTEAYKSGEYILRARVPGETYSTLFGAGSRGTESSMTLPAGKRIEFDLLKAGIDDRYIVAVFDNIPKEDYDGEDDNEKKVFLRPVNPQLSANKSGLGVGQTILIFSMTSFEASNGFLPFCDIPISKLALGGDSIFDVYTGGMTFDLQIGENKVRTRVPDLMTAQQLEFRFKRENGISKNNRVVFCLNGMEWTGSDFIDIPRGTVPTVYSAVYDSSVNVEKKEYEYEDGDYEKKNSMPVFSIYSTFSIEFEKKKKEKRKLDENEEEDDNSANKKSKKKINK